MDMKATQADMAAEYDMKTLIEAEKIRKDKKRYGAAMKKFKEAYAAMEAVEMKSGSDEDK